MEAMRKFICMLLLFSFFCEATPLDSFLAERGYRLAPSGIGRSGEVICEGYVTPKQKELFVHALVSALNIYNIAEVGFNAGHTSEIFLNTLPNCQVTSFDINAHPYTKVGEAYMQQTYPGRFQLIEGDSQLTVPAFAIAHPDKRFDFIYIDGCHSFEACLNDIFHFRALAHENTVVWIDDANFPDVKRAIAFAARLRIIDSVKLEEVEDSFGLRSWAVARYINLRPL